jgi:hypothetical protein
MVPDIQNDIRASAHPRQRGCCRQGRPQEQATGPAAAAGPERAGTAARQRPNRHYVEIPSD